MPEVFGISGIDGAAIQIPFTVGQGRPALHPLPADIVNVALIDFGRKPAH